MRRFLLVAAASFLAACSGSGTDPLSTSIVGTYNLMTVSGASLPIMQQAANPKIELIAEQIVVSSGGSFTISTTKRVTNGSTVTTPVSSDAGSYVISGTAITFTFTSSGTAVPATLSGNTLTLTSSTSTSVYVK